MYERIEVLKEDLHVLDMISCIMQHKVCWGGCIALPMWTGTHTHTCVCFLFVEAERRDLNLTHPSFICYFGHANLGSLVELSGRYGQ